MTAKAFKDVDIDDVLSKAEQKFLALRLWARMQIGYGKVSITVEKGHPRRIETTDSETLPSPKDE